MQEGRSIKWQGKVIKADQATKKIAGRSVAFVFDTAYCKEAIKLEKNASIVISEATFRTELEVRASEVGHLTAKQAAQIAKKAKAKKLYLMHISRRYKGKENLLLRDAKKVFKNSYLAQDLMQVKV